MNIVEVIAISIGAEGAKARPKILIILNILTLIEYENHSWKLSLYNRIFPREVQSKKLIQRPNSNTTSKK
ncbi:hypothetical protein [Bacillus sp. EB01]|uniref:hypothetical protein n=1 Tax=Bacillus sp. EB01 TaxID=1347086 RepID=UPI0005C6F7F3|nr:hypothetical protein [Bacillus sp. EB01]